VHPRTDLGSLDELDPVMEDPAIGLELVSTPVQAVMLTTIGEALPELLNV
jgi:hypothetical protein